MLAAGVGVQGEVVEAAVGQAVAVVLGLLDLGDQADFGEGRDGLARAAGAAAQARDLLDEGGRDQLVVFGSLFGLEIGSLISDWIIAVSRIGSSLRLGVLASRPPRDGASPWSRASYWRMLVAIANNGVWCVVVFFPGRFVHSLPMLLAEINFEQEA